MGDDYRKFGTFPSKPTPITPMSNNKFQRMASIHKQQEESGNFFPKKIHFGGNPKLQYREGGEKFHKTEQGRAQKFQKNGQAGANKKFEHDGKEEEEEEGAEDVDGESGSDDDEEERLKFREEISKMPIGKVREMKEKLGIKLFNKTYFGTSEVEKKRKETKKAEISRSENHGQHRPKEISSKRHVSTFRNIYGEHEKGTKKKRWDPRFDSRAGDFKEVCFENNYQFLDEIRDGEIKDLQSEYKVARTDGDEKKAARLKNTLQKMETSEKTRAEKRRQAETRKELHDDNIQRMLRGEAPIFRTKGTNIYSC
uniref:rRNA biogenesis protein RRP36 n=1 Tax=Caenorhabditis japonica TaxID=281687 RepID=A0A8R1ERC8_CAEJA